VIWEELMEMLGVKIDIHQPLTHFL